MKYFIDFEFLEGDVPVTLCGVNIPKWLIKPNNTIQPISVGIASSDGREYYAVSKDFNLYEAWNRSDSVKAVGFRDTGMTKVYEPVYWIRDNVLKVIFNDMESLEFDKTGIAHHEFTYSDFKELLNTHGKSNEQIKEEILEFVKGNQNPLATDNNGKLIGIDNTPIEFYGYYSDYDWVCFCWLFGRMIKLPTGFPMYCNDLKQELDYIVQYNDYGYTAKIRDKWISSNKEERLNLIKSNSKYPKQTVAHSSLHDARFNRDLYNFLKTL